MIDDLGQTTAIEVHRDLERLLCDLVLCDVSFELHLHLGNIDILRIHYNQ